MIQIRRANERGHFNFGWLDTYHTFSFGDYYDPRNMGFSDLRVINEDVVDAGGGFPLHGHRDMEIITYILSGGLKHSDSMGNGSIIRPGDVQRMSAGTGVRHSEANASDTEPVHLLQIWIMPGQDGNPPSYEEKKFSEEEKHNRLRVVAAPDGRDGAVTVQQDAFLYAGVLDDGVSVNHELAPGRKAWLQVARGSAEINGQLLEPGDGVAIVDESTLTITGRDGAEVLLFDLRP